MSVAEWLTADSETVLWEGQPRVGVVLWGLGGGLVAAVVLGAVAWLAFVGLGVPAGLRVALLALVALLAVAVPTGAAWVWRRVTHYVLTERALYHRTGVLSVRVTELPLRQIQNTSYTQGVTGVVLGHGTVTVETAGSEGAELTLRAMDDPGTVQQRIADQASRVTGSDTEDVPGSLDQWQAVRAEVRGIRAVLSRR